MQLHRLRSLALAAAFCAAGCRATPDYGRSLPPGAPALLPVDDRDRPDFADQWYEREEILPALDRSIAWMKKESSRRFYPIAGIDHARAQASLERFRALLVESRDAAAFGLAIQTEFEVLQSAGWNGKGGGVLYTGYYTPIFEGSLSRAGEFRYPLYGLPPDLVKGQDGEILGRRTPNGAIEPYPDRRAIEGAGLLAGRGLELAWLADPLDAFIAHVNGSAFIELQDGRMLRLGYAGKNGRPYSSLGAALVADEQLPADGVGLAAIRRWAKEHPDRLTGYLDRNESYVFFTPIEGNPRGSLNVEVEPGRSLATDKTRFPRAALVYVDTRLPAEGGGERMFERFLFDQDTGGAIRTAGRADIYLGVGPEVEALAGRTKAEGQLYYLFLEKSGPALLPYDSAAQAAAASRPGGA